MAAPSGVEGRSTSARTHTTSHRSANGSKNRTPRRASFRALGASRRAPRIALDCRGLHWLGIGRYCRELARELPRVAPDLDFLWLAGPAGATELPVAPNARVRIVRSRLLGVGEQLEVPLALRREHVDLFHAPNSYTHPLLAGRFVVTVHDLTLKRFRAYLPNPIGRAYYDLMTGTAVRGAERILTVSHFTAADVASSWSEAAPRLRPVWNGVGAGFRPVRDPAAIARVRAAYGLPESFVLYIGSCKPHKNLPRLIEAYAGLPPTLRAAHPLVLVARPDPRYPEIEAAIARRGLAADVRWCPDVAEADLAALYSLAALFVMPSLHEGFGFPLAEAMACGAASLAANAASLPEIGGDACAYADPLDAGAIRDGLERLLADAGARADLSRRGLERARRFSWEDTARSVAAVYREALG
jgi:glycosyltransferase involved in cell wall biosynthesis